MIIQLKRRPDTGYYISKNRKIYFYNRSSDKYYKCFFNYNYECRIFSKEAADIGIGEILDRLCIIREYCIRNIDESSFIPGSVIISISSAHNKNLLYWFRYDLSDSRK